MRKRAYNNTLLFLFGQVLIFLFLINRLFRSSTSDLTPLMTSFEEMSQNLTMDSSKSIFKQQYRFEYEQLQNYSLKQVFEEPSINQTSYPKLPYFYSLWKTSSMLPRLITPDEHFLYIQLLNTFDLLSKKHSFEYFITFGTLIGSYRNHGKIYENASFVFAILKKNGGNIFL